MQPVLSRPLLRCVACDRGSVEGANCSGVARARDHHAEAAAVFASSPLDTLKGVYHHGSEFLGYEETDSAARVIGLIAQNRLVESASAAPEGAPAASQVILVLDRTPFYGEGGGQAGAWQGLPCRRQGVCLRRRPALRYVAAS